MNSHKKIMALASFAALVMAAQASAFDGSQYAKEATLSIEQARALAIKAYPGTIVEEELEHKLGGSGLRYSFDIRANHVTHEVAVDAKTGNILQNSRESANDND